MNKRIVDPLIKFLRNADNGTWMRDFQFKHINYASKEVACSINAGINYNNTTFIIDIEDDNQ